MTDNYCQAGAMVTYLEKRLHKERMMEHYKMCMMEFLTRSSIREIQKDELAVNDTLHHAVHAFIYIYTSKKCQQQLPQ